jgi:alginate O-acetyltransferase complex protein AlgI
MLLGGLWHGANWTFVVWGGLHGLYLWVEKFFRDRKEPVRLVVARGSAMAVVEGSGQVLPKPVHEAGSRYYLTPGRAWPYALLTFLLVVVTWVFFRASTFGGAGKLLGAMFGFIHGGSPLLSTVAMLKVAIITAVMLASQWLLRHSRILEVAHRLPWWLTGLFWSAIVILLVLSQASSSSFIYFQF